MDYINNLISDPMLRKIIIVVIGIIILSTIIRFTKKNLYKYVKEKSNWYKTKKAVNVFGYFIIVLFIILIFSDTLGEVTVVLGVIGAGLTFALQEVIMSVAGWLAILITDIFKTGDRVLLGGIKGDVIDLGILRTTIMELGQWVDGDLYNGRIVRISNSFIFKEPVYNYSADFPFLWDEIKIPVQYGNNYKEVRKIISDVALEVVGEYCAEAQKHWDIVIRKYLIENASTQPMVTIIANDNWVEFTLRYVVDYKKRRTTRDELYTKLMEELEGHRITLASATFQIVGMPAMDVNINNSINNK